VTRHSASSPRKGRRHLYIINNNITITDMKKFYICPSVNINEAQASQMLAESLNVVSDKTVDGSQALSPEDKSWDIWGEE